MISPVTETKYPIICSPMNGVSDVKLAIACHNAGILPSLVPYCYSTDDKIDIPRVEAALGEYMTATNNGKLLIAVESFEYADEQLFNLLVKYKISMVEVLDVNRETLKGIYQTSLKAKEHNIKTALKITGGLDMVEKIFNHIGQFDGISIKGPAGAGRGNDYLKLEHEIPKIKKQFPNLSIIASGGINTSENVKTILDLGADAVSIGTMFCASEESSLSPETKNKVINSSMNDVKRLPTGERQKALIFSAVKETDTNNTAGLIEGVKTGTSGHIFVGSGIDYITAIKPVSEIVNDLVKDL